MKIHPLKIETNTVLSRVRRVGSLAICDEQVPAAPKLVSFEIQPASLDRRPGDFDAGASLESAAARGVALDVPPKAERRHAKTRHLVVVIAILRIGNPPNNPSLLNGNNSLPPWPESAPCASACVCTYDTLNRATS